MEKGHFGDQTRIFLGVPSRNEKMEGDTYACTLPKPIYAAQYVVLVKFLNESRPRSYEQGKHPRSCIASEN